MPLYVLALALRLAAPAPTSLVDKPFPRLDRGAPTLRWGAKTRCLAHGGGDPWRAQCDDAKKACLVAPGHEVLEDGSEGPALTRVPPCEPPRLDGAKLAADGYALVPALAEAQPGWRRDGRQRIMQVNFDLDRRLWLGGGFAFAGAAPGAGHATVGLGLRTEAPLGEDAPGERGLLRLSLFEGEASVDGALLDVRLMELDTSKEYERPLVRVTTFVGAPRRFDLGLDVGFWGEAVRYETVDAGDGRWARLELGAAAATVDLWRSRDMASYVRLRGGAGIEEERGTRIWSVTPGGALEADVTLDRDGFHHLTALVSYERLVPTVRAPLAPPVRERLEVRAGYELVLVAVDDQPLSAFVEGRAFRRNDAPPLAGKLGWQTTAGLRFSFWAPARRDARAQGAL